MKKLSIILISIILSLNTFAQDVIKNDYNQVDGDTAEFLYATKLINDYRISQGLDALEVDTNAVKASEHHANYLYLNHETLKYTNTNAHIQIKTSVTKKKDLLVEAGDRRMKFGANPGLDAITMGTAATADKYKLSVKTAVQALINSKPHRKILLYEGDRYGKTKTIGVYFLLVTVDGYQHSYLVVNICY